MPYINAGLFNRFPPVEISAELWTLLTGNRQVRKFSKNTFLAVQGEPVRNIIILKKGRVKAVFISSGGREILFELLIAPAVFGYQALYSGDIIQMYPNLEALTECDAVFVPVGEVEELTDREPGLLKCFYQCLNNNVSTFSGLSLWTQRLNLLKKVAFAISITGNMPRDEKGYFRMTHENLADFLGVTRENVTVSLNRLCEMGLIEKKPGKIRIADADAFAEYINDIYEEL